MDEHPLLDKPWASVTSLGSTINKHPLLGEFWVTTTRKGNTLYAFHTWPSSHRSGRAYVLYDKQHYWIPRDHVMLVDITNSTPTPEQAFGPFDTLEAACTTLALRVTE